MARSVSRTWCSSPCRAAWRRAPGSRLAAGLGCSMCRPEMGERRRDTAHAANTDLASSRMAVITSGCGAHAGRRRGRTAEPRLKWRWGAGCGSPHSPGHRSVTRSTPMPRHRHANPYRRQLSPCCSGAALLLPLCCCPAVALLLLWRCSVVGTLLLLCCWHSGVAMVLLCCWHSAVALLLLCCSAVALLLCCSAASLTSPLAATTCFSCSNSSVEQFQAATINCNN